MNTKTLALTQGNDYTVCLPLVVKDAEGVLTPITASSVQSLSVVLTLNGEPVPQYTETYPEPVEAETEPVEPGTEGEESGEEPTPEPQPVRTNYWSVATSSNLVCLELTEQMPTGAYGLEVKGVYGGKDIRWSNTAVFRIVNYNAQSTVLDHLAAKEQTLEPAVFVAAGSGGGGSDLPSNPDWKALVDKVEELSGVELDYDSSISDVQSAIESISTGGGGGESIIERATLNDIIDLFEGLTGQQYSAATSDEDNQTLCTTIGTDLATAKNALTAKVNSKTGKQPGDSGYVGSASDLDDITDAVDTLHSNADYNAETQATSWERSMTKDEWGYLFNTRSASTVNGTANARYAKGTVNSVAGVILFPDSYTHPDGVAQPTNINSSGANYTGNNYSTSDWTAMQAAGAVFLPQADSGYWTSTPQQSASANAWRIYFDATEIRLATESGSDRINKGTYCSVRLIRKNDEGLYSVSNEQKVDISAYNLTYDNNDFSFSFTNNEEIGVFWIGSTLGPTFPFMKGKYINDVNS